MTEGTSPPVGITPIVQRGELAQELSSSSKLDALLRLQLSHLQLVKEECEQEFQLCWELVFQRLEPSCLKNAPVRNAGRHQQAKLVTIQLISHSPQEVLLLHSSKHIQLVPVFRKSKVKLRLVLLCQWRMGWYIKKLRVLFCETMSWFLKCPSQT